MAKQKEQRAAAAARTLQQQQTEKAKAAATSASTTTTATGPIVSAPSAVTVTVAPSPAVTVTMTKTASPAPSSVATVVPTPTTITIPLTSPLGGRPSRNSKINAMDKVKQWVGNNMMNQGGSSGSEETYGKRKVDSDYDPEEDDEGSIKKMKTDSGAVNQALVKAQQSGSVKIVSVGAKSPVKVVNGVGGVSKKEDGNAAEVIVKTAKDGTASGVVKKPGFTGAKNVAGEAQVQIVNRGEVSKQGVFKVNSNSPSPQSSPVATPRATPPGMTTTTTTRIVRKNIGGTQQLVKQVVRTTIPIQQAQQQQQQQQQVGQTRQPLQKMVNNTSPGGAPIPKLTTNIVQRSSLSPGQTKPPVNRNLRSTPPSRNTTPEQKINALRKQGLNVVKRVVSPATQVEQKPAVINHDEDEDDGIPDPFPSNFPAPVPPSPPRALTLCPVTGKVLGQAEGEPAPVPEDDKAKHKKQQQLQAQQEQHDAQQEQDTQVHQILTNEDGSPIIVAGEDGTLYQVAGKNAEGQTILIAQGADGEQQCVLVASQEGEAEDGNGGVLTLDAAVSEAVAQIGGVPQEVCISVIQAEFVFDKSCFTGTTNDRGASSSVQDAGRRRSKSTINNPDRRLPRWTNYG